MRFICSLALCVMLIALSSCGEEDSAPINVLASDICNEENEGDIRYDASDESYIVCEDGAWRNADYSIILKFDEDSVATSSSKKVESSSSAKIKSSSSGKSSSSRAVKESSSSSKPKSSSSSSDEEDKESSSSAKNSSSSVKSSSSKKSSSSQSSSSSEIASSSGIASSSSVTESSSSSEEKRSSSSAESLVFNDTVPYTGVPRIIIETVNGTAIEDKVTEIPARLQVFGETQAETPVYEITIRGRGNLTWSYAKKPYTFVFNDKQPFLGMPKAKKWLMIANFRDRTLIKNAVSLEIARRFDYSWQPHGQFADVYLNNKFIGNYYICEKIQVQKNRLNLSDNGYLMEFDENYDGNYKFKSKYRKLPINITEPELLTTTTFKYIQSYIDSLECILDGDEDCEDLDYNDFIDLKSFADYWLVQEVVTNAEAVHPKSLYIYKDTDTKLMAGPAWDFDWATFDPNKKGFQGILPWVDSLLKKQEFVDIVKQEWLANRDKLENMDGFIDSIADYTKKSNDENHKVWPVTVTKGVIGDERMELDEALDMLRNTYHQRLKELDGLIDEL